MLSRLCSSLVPVRGDLHILIVGDPGLGKSQMLQAVHQVRSLWFDIGFCRKVLKCEFFVQFATILIRWHLEVSLFAEMLQPRQG